MKCEKIIIKLLNKDSVSSYKSKNVTILGWSRFYIIAIRVGQNSVILGQPYVLEIKYIKFLYQAVWWEIYIYFFF